MVVLYRLRLAFAPTSHVSAPSFIYLPIRFMSALTSLLFALVLVLIFLLHNSSPFSARFHIPSPLADVPSQIPHNSPHSRGLLLLLFIVILLPHVLAPLPPVHIPAHNLPIFLLTFLLMLCLIFLHMFLPIRLPTFLHISSSCSTNVRPHFLFTYPP